MLPWLHMGGDRSTWAGCGRCVVGVNVPELDSIPALWSLIRLPLNWATGLVCTTLAPGIALVIRATRWAGAACNAYGPGGVIVASIAAKLYLARIRFTTAGWLKVGRS